MAAQPAITIWATDDGRRCIPAYISAYDLAQVFDWLKLSPEAWTKMKIEGIPPRIERVLEVRLQVLESFRMSQKLASSAARDLESEPNNEEYSFDNENTPEHSEFIDNDDYAAPASEPSLRNAIEKIESPRRARMLIEAILEDIRVPSIDCDPVKSYAIYDEIVNLLYSGSCTANSIAAKNLVFGLLIQAGRYRKDERIDIALELEFLACAIDLIAYRKRQRPTHARNLWF
jgi:hypothetical protein